MAIVAPEIGAFYLGNTFGVVDTPAEQTALVGQTWSWDGVGTDNTADTSEFQYQGETFNEGSPNQLTSVYKDTAEAGSGFDSWVQHNQTDGTPATQLNVVGINDIYVNFTTSSGTYNNVSMWLVQLSDGTTFMVADYPSTGGAQDYANTVLGSEILSFEMASVSAQRNQFTPPADDWTAGAEPPNGIVEGTAGDDNIDSAYIDADGDQVSTNADTVYGYGGNDTINSGNGDDTLYGGDGNDTIMPGAGADSIDAGAGDDLVWLSDSDSVDGGSGFDTFDATFGAFGETVTFTSATGGTTDNGTTFINMAGFISGDGADTYDASLATSNLSIETGNDDDSVIGGFGNDTIDGGDGADTLAGGGGSDTIFGNIGSDSISGGAGADTLYGGASEAASVGGTNTLGTSYSVIRLGSGPEIDTIEGNAANENSAGLLGTYGGVGNELYNSILDASVTDTNSNTRIDFDDEVAPEPIVIDGVSKVVDTGVVYNATVTFTDGSSGTFTAVVIQTTDGDIYLVPELSDNVDNSLLTSQPIESITLDSINVDSSNVTAVRLDADYVLGDTDTSGDVISGGAGDDTIYGGAGDDTLDGGTGNDTVQGGTGSDTILLKNGYFGDSIAGGEDGDNLDIDTLDASGITADGVDVFMASDETGSVTSSQGTANFSEIESFVLTDQDDNFDASATNNGVTGDEPGVTVDGRGGDDTIIGGRGADTIDGGTGADTIVGDYGDDILSGGDGDDTIYGDDIAGNEIGNDTIDGGAGADFIDGGNQADSITGGTGGDTVLGGEGDDTIDGGDDDDSIDGGEGADEIYGGDGNDILDDRDDSGNANSGDTLYGGAGDDTLVAGYDSDTFYGGTGNDTYDIDGSVVRDFAFDIDLSAGTDTYANEYDGIENVIGGTAADTITGDAADNSLDGRAGDDSLDGGAGADTLVGGAGADTLTGGSGADVFVVDGGADTITDFDTTTGIDGGASDDNDFVDLTGFYNTTNLAAWNAANPAQTYTTPLGWLRADQADGTLGEAGNLVIARDNAAVAASELNAENTGVVCFAQGTLIKTARGEVSVEDIREGDLVQTMDNGFQPVRWIGRRVVRQDELRARPSLRPIRVNKDIFGIGSLDQDLVVSPQHRLLLVSKVADRMFGTREVLMSAKKLLDMTGAAEIEDVKDVRYFHMLFDRHEIIFANSIPAESLYLGSEALRSLSDAGRAEIHILFPEIADNDFAARGCRPFAEGRRAKRLAFRLSKNKKPLAEQRRA